MNNQPTAVVTCTNCGEQTPLSDLRSGERCQKCQQVIDPDAPTKIRTEAVEGHWDKLIDENYTPAGGVDFSRDEISEPDRDVEAITEVLTGAESGDVLAVTIGAAEFQGTAKVYVLSHERGVAGFDHRVSFVSKPRDDGWTRLYTTGIDRTGEFDPWKVVSAPYDLGGDRTADMRDFAAHGWMLDARARADADGLEADTGGQR